MLLGHLKNKKPFEKFSFVIDYVNVLEAGETISSADLSAVDSEGNDASYGSSDPILASASGTINGSQVSVPVEGGTANKRYTITCRVTTSSGNKYEDSVEVHVV